ncbi:MAG: tetratricopeptide repeat protein [Rhodothermales bacterium]|nr:tetratricopeptide repeat protein [Rhodothermales bacterium]
MKNAVLGVFIIIAVLAPPSLLAQQTPDEYFESGILAFREQRYADAAQDFERVVSMDPENPEAYFLLARIYHETPIADESKARKSLETAMQLDPDNVQYMVARLLQLREDGWSFISDKIRESKRRSLSIQILALDSTNAYAHEEMGAGFIRDFWRYRNAIMIPGLNLGRGWGQEQRWQDSALEESGLSILDPTQATADEVLAQDYFQRTSGLENIANVADPTDVFFADEFDLERMESVGEPIQDLSQRAARVYNRAIFHLKSALEANPRHRSVYDHLMQVYALKGEYGEALKLLANMYVYYPDDEKLWTYLGYAHYKAGNLEAAAKSFETALEKLPQEELAAYNNLAYIISEEDKVAFRKDPDRFASTFWASKDPRFLTSYNERKIEHYSRLVYADLLYGSPQLNRRGWETERGQILVRYGPPNVEVTIFPHSALQINAKPTTYAGSVEGEGGGRSIDSNSRFEELNTYNIWDYGDFKFVFEDPFRTGEYRLYSPRADLLGAGALPWQNDYTIIAKETIRETPERYEYEAPGRQIELPYVVNTFKGKDGASDVYVHYGVPVGDYDVSKDNIEVTAKEGAFIISDSHDILAEKRRTIYGLRTAQIVRFDEANLWVNTQAFSTSPGKRDVSVEFELGAGTTVAVQRRTIDVPGFEEDRLSMSDMMLGYAIEETPDGKPLAAGEVVRKGLSINPAPWSVFAVDQPIYLYFEVYGLSPDPTGSREYKVEAILSKKDERSGIAKAIGGIFRRGDRGVSLTLPFTSQSPDDGQYLILDAENQEPGLYSLTLKVSDTISRKSVDTSKDLFLE